MRLVKHRKIVTCPWCNAGATMTFEDGRGEFCMACKRQMDTGELMARIESKLPYDARAIE